MKLSLISLFIFGTTLLFKAQTTISVQFDSLHGKDAWVWSFDDYENVNFGTAKDTTNGGLYNVIRAESWQWKKGISDTIRSFIEFNLVQINKKSKIKSATLYLGFFANKGFTKQVGENKMIIQLVQSKWNEETINWKNQPLSITDKQITVEKSTDKEQSYVIDITEFVKLWVAKPKANYGMMLRMENEVPFSGLTFASRENKNTSILPKLVIEIEN